MAGLNFEQAPKTNQKHSYFIFKFNISYIHQYPNDKTVSLMSLILLVDKKTKNQGQNHMAYVEEEGGYHIGSASVPLLGDHRSEHWIHVHPSKFSFTSSWAIHYTCLCTSCMMLVLEHVPHKQAPPVGCLMLWWWTLEIRT